MPIVLTARWGYDDELGYLAFDENGEPFPIAATVESALGWCPIFLTAGDALEARRVAADKARQYWRHKRSGRAIPKDLRDWNFHVGRSFGSVYIPIEDIIEIIQQHPGEMCEYRKMLYKQSIKQGSEFIGEDYGI